ncbi:ABC transporter permease [Clostridium sp. D2Q-11]|uniref:ABC transporter permease n=1 Tax=Anaeromonas frigoriresistens TaxID=2683708 RepID=A0A942Z8E8_9FIRM|nr:ABC transporter permease [Anaeromonas frigoriresistens]MBS4537909.1 ABC transporter permease [Anaeromonas frigoriresistens]
MLSVIKLRLLKMKQEYPVILFLTLMALGLTFIFGKSMGEYRPSVIVVDQDNTEYSQKVIEKITEENPYKFQYMNYDDAISEVEEYKSIAAIVIEEGFEDSIENKNSPKVGILKIKDDLDSITLKNALESNISRMIGDIRLSSVIVNELDKSINIENKEKTFDSTYKKISEAWKYRKPIKVTKDFIDSSGEGFDQMNHALIGFSIFFSTYTMVFGIGTILEDKQNNTWSRMLVSPVSRGKILGGTFITTYATGALQLIVLIFGGKYLFNVDWGNSTLGILTIGAAFVFAVTCFGLLLSGIVKTHQQLAAMTPVILTSTAMLGGAMWPLEIVNSKIILFLANLTPQKWAIQGMEQIVTYGKGFNVAIIPSLILLLMGSIFLSVGVFVINEK